MMHSILSRAARSHSMDEDRARREFIFNVLILGALVLVAVAVVDNTAHVLFSDPSLHQADSLSSFAFIGLFACFTVLYVLSKRGHALVASFVVLAAIFDLAAYMGYRWGVDLSASLLFYALAIAMAGILIHARFAFVTALLAGISIGITVHLHRTGAIYPDRGWITEMWKMDDVIVATFIFLVIALVMWLSNREIEKSLARARRSEADLKQERDLLEIRVEERTRELRQVELERMTQAYRFVEFGKLASGIFHDLMNPLAGLTLNIDRIADAPESRTTLSEDVQRAKRAAMHMQKLLTSMRRHLTQERHEEYFSVQQSVEETLQIVATHAAEHQVCCSFAAVKDVQFYGDPVAFAQVLTNLVNNAVQSFPNIKDGADYELLGSREVRITLTAAADQAELTVEDMGSGIPEDVLPHIFEPYFTTKGIEHGIGLGLSLAKRIVEKDFGGSLSVKSRVGEGTTFLLLLPIRES